MEMDVETVHETTPDTRFDRILVVLVGLGAVLAAALAAIQLEAGKQEERALLYSSRLAVQVFELTAGTAPITAFSGSTAQEAIGISARGLGRQIVALQAAEGSERQLAIGTAEQRAGERLLPLAASMAAQAPSPEGIDPHTGRLLEIASDDVRAFARVLREGSGAIDFRAGREGFSLTDAFNAQVSLADRHSDRETLALLGLALLALGGVLVGLAAVLRERSGAWFALGTAVVALLVAGGLGGIALVR